MIHAIESNPLSDVEIKVQKDELYDEDNEE